MIGAFRGQTNLSVLRRSETLKELARGSMEVLSWWVVRTAKYVPTMETQNDPMLLSLHQCREPLSTLTAGAEVASGRCPPRSESRLKPTQTAGHQTGPLKGSQRGGRSSVKRQMIHPISHSYVGNSFSRRGDILSPGSILRFFSWWVMLLLTDEKGNCSHEGGESAKSA